MKMNSFGYLFITIGIVLTVNKYVTQRNEIIIENNKIENTIQKQIGYLKKDNIDTYDGILSIPQINLKKGVYNKGDKRNNIEENITIHELSNYPNEENSNLILMAHSGSGRKAFFNDLYKLNNDSLIEFYYQGIKYVYKVGSYYEIEKNGLASIDKDITKKSITLITCSQSDKTKQLIYIGYLIDEIKY